jgi:hypothetical protein
LQIAQQFRDASKMPGSLFILHREISPSCARSSEWGANDTGCCVPREQDLQFRVLNLFGQSSGQILRSNS